MPILVFALAAGSALFTAAAIKTSSCTWIKRLWMKGWEFLMKAYECAFYGGKISHEPTDKYLHINSCGYFRGLEFSETMGVYREHGFPDYQIIYILSGSMRFLISGETKILSEGDIIVYPPNVVQKYKCVSKPGVSYVWVHFCGKAAREVLSEAGVSENEVQYAAPDTEAYSLIGAMAQEMKIKRAGSEAGANGLFLEFLALLSRNMKSVRPEERKYSRILPALRDMENETRRRSNKEYAELCGLTECYFIHLFKEVTHVSPIKYISDMLIKKSECLITDTDMEISDIAAFLGYESPSYFSKRFREYYGHTPSEHRAYRRQR